MYADEERFPGDDDLREGEYIDISQIPNRRGESSINWKRPG